MKIAKMDKRITLQRPVTHEDGYGGLETVFEDAGKVWAKMERTDYAEQQANQHDLDELIQQTADQAIAHDPANGEALPQRAEPVQKPTRSKEGQTHDEAR